MKARLPALSLLVLGLAAPVVAVSTAAEPSPANSSLVQDDATDRLWIAVHLAKSTKPAWVGDDMADSFADAVAKALRAQGYKGKISTLRPEDAAPSRAAVLVVRLSAWTASGGFANCTFTASLRTSGGDSDLGAFVGDNVIVTADGRQRISSDGLLGSAEEAMNDLYGRLQATGLLKTS